MNMKAFMTKKKDHDRTTWLASLALALILAACSTNQVADPTSAEAESVASELPGSPVFVRTGATPMIDFSGVQKTLGGEPTRVLVLGTRHLSYLKEEEFDPANLSLLLDRLEVFAPQIIAIEAVPGRTCDEIQRYQPLYPDTQGYCLNDDAALDALEMTRPQASAALELMLAEWGGMPTPGQRRRLALLFLGAGELWSGVLQWSLLEPHDRVAADGLTGELVEQLNKRLESRNENRLIGVEMAKRIGLQKLAAMDDHSADIIQTRAPESLDPVIQSAWGKVHPLESELAQRKKGSFGTPEQVIDDYLFVNSPAYQRYTIEEDFGQAAATPDEDAVARQYVAWWQARGLRMTANVIEAAGNQPGARVLVIVGSSHKAYFDAYLDQMHDVELVSVEAVLKE